MWAPYVTKTKQKQTHGPPVDMDSLTEVVAAPGADETKLRGLAMRGVGDLADQEGLGQRMAWGAALATQCLGEGARSHGTEAREVLS